MGHAAFTTRIVDKNIRVIIFLTLRVFTFQLDRFVQFDRNCPELQDTCLRITTRLSVPQIVSQCSGLFKITKRRDPVSGFREIGSAIV